MIGLIMAGGKGTRMQSNQEKLLLEYKKPLILHVIDALKNSNCFEKIFAATSPNSPQTRKILVDKDVTVIETLGENFVTDLNNILKDLDDYVFVTSGDLPLLDKKVQRIANGTLDTLLRGSGIYGVAVSTLKNMIIKFAEQREKGYNKDESAVIMELANFSPVVGIKARKVVNAEKTLNYNKKVMKEMETFDIDNMSDDKVYSIRLYKKGERIFPKGSLDRCDSFSIK